LRLEGGVSRDLILALCDEALKIISGALTVALYVL
jgi:hypothetical protein